MSLYEYPNDHFKLPYKNRNMAGVNFYNFDTELMLDFNWFLYKINERSNIGYR